MATNGDERISVLTGNILWNMGTASKLPKAWLWFYRYLVSDGQRLDDREAMCVTLLISLEEGVDSAGLRLDDLPAVTPLAMLRKYQTHWKQMGLLFTSRQFYSPAQVCRFFGGNVPPTPRFKNTLYDLSNLFYNISLVAQEWARCNAEYRVEQEQRGIANPKPYTFSSDYAHEIILSPDVAARIVTGAYERGRAGSDFSEDGQKRWYIPPKWWNTAHQMFGLSPDLNERARDDVILEQIEAGQLSCQVLQNGALGSAKCSKTAHLASAECSKTAHLASAECAKTAHSLIKEKEKKEEEKVSFLLSKFSAHKNDPVYQPGANERRKVESLIAEGYTVEQIAAAIEQAFDTRVPGAKSVRGFGFIVTYIHQHPVCSLTENPIEVPVQAVTGEPHPTEPSLESTRETTGDVAEDLPMIVSDNDALNRVWILLQAANVKGLEGVPDAIYDQPGVRLGLRQFVQGLQPYTPDEIYAAVLAAVSRGQAVPPDRVVNYARTVLENGRREAREREQNQLQFEFDAAPDDSELPSFGEQSEDTIGEAVKLWSNTLAELELQMTHATFNTWLKPTRMVGWDSSENGGAQAVIGVPNEYVGDWLRNRLIIPIRRTLAAIAGQSDVQIEFVATTGESH